MAVCFSSVHNLLWVCVLWAAWTHCIKGDCRQIRHIKFYPPEIGYYLEGHVLLNLSIGVYRQCEERCLMESDCVSVNIGPPINDKVVCELSDSDYLQHREDLKRRCGWTYRGTENLCSTKPCLNDGKCLMGYTDKNYLCVCQAGYTGENCETDIDECSNKGHDCHENATCINTAGHFNCSCRSGYTGNGRLCSDIDECKNGSHDCNENATCINTAGHFNCSCKPGYIGPGRLCSDIDECNNGSHDCNENATCINTAGHFNCSCKPGYIGDGRLCLDIDECNNGSHDCNENATCINTAGHFNCSCKPGYTGDGRSCSDCLSNLHRFEKYQDLPTEAANAVEQFSIDGSQFLAFANRNGDIDRFETDSFIYKLNESTSKFFLYQTIDTTGGRDIEYFTIDKEHYLAVANRQNGGMYQMNSTIYKWSGHQFVVLQNISTNGASGFNFFKILPDLFLVVTNTHSPNSTIYNWKSNQFEKFQEIKTEEAKASTAFVVKNNTFLAFANYKSSQEGNSVKSSVFKWSGKSFVEFQSLQTYGAYDVKSFNVDGDAFLAFANYYNGSSYKTDVDSFIYKWDGNKFVLFQSIPTRGARAWHPFVLCRQTFLGVANYIDQIEKYSTRSVVFRTSGKQCIPYQEILTEGASDMTSFEYNGHTFLATANVRNTEKRNINSTVYKWI